MICRYNEFLINEKLSFDKLKNVLNIISKRNSDLKKYSIKAKNGLINPFTIATILLSTISSCNKEDMGPNKWCIGGSDFSKPGIVLDKETNDDGNNVTSITILTSDSLGNPDTVVYHDLTDNMALNIQVGDSLINCQH